MTLRQSDQEIQATLSTTSLTHAAALVFDNEIFISLIFNHVLTNFPLN